MTPIIVVLDYPGAAPARELVAKLDPGVCRLKIGKELHTAAGPALIDEFQRKGFQIFLDLKFHDIPNTVAAACRVAAAQGVWMLNVHASGGGRMMAAAREAIDKSAGTKPLLIAVTVLTSLSDAEMPEVGFAGSAADNVLRLAAATKAQGLDGVVCSAMEASLLKSCLGREFLLVTPGIRIKGGAAGDQSRVVTPVDAITMGADYLVIGRSITHAADPTAVLEKIVAQLAVARDDPMRLAPAAAK